MLRVTICAVGRLRGGPEAELVGDYLGRFGRTGRQVGLGPAAMAEVDARGSGSAEEGRLLVAAIPAGATIVALDERGRSVASDGFADLLGRWADEGRRDVAFLIGGADGLSREALERADLTLSFGAMVWPHMLARVMLAEQLYRAASILAGTPYHRA
jgi:23S rRNA (pseudouridine1915-N3)-methyltransferase